MPDFLFRGSLDDLDPAVYQLTQLEAERQYRKLILIPSESSAPLAVRQAMASAFQNIYAEGYPDEATRRMTEAEILDLEPRLAHYRRYSDPRYYKGVEYVDVIEALARRRCAEAFAANGVSPDELYVNVQPLSGGPANNAIYHALVEPGDTVMGMNLIHGGHLSHGSPVNRSGKYYNAVHYNVDADTERIVYEQLEALAHEHRPKIIIGGYSSYPWTVNWGRFRDIADSVGAYLMADIAHVAGLVAAGAYPSPVGHAQVISFTTHKSLCGPRGAVVMTSDPKLAKKLDRAVFPGEQGGPHINTIAAQALTFKLAQTDAFRQLQHRIVDNCVALTQAIADEGLRIPFGGTDTHLSNVDCKSVVGADGTTLSGDLAARILDIVGIVCNRNTIPGDRSAANPSGIRLGTPWITQRGFTVEDSRKLGKLIAKVLKGCRPYAYPRRGKDVQRAKIDFDLLESAKIEVRDLALSIGIDFDPPEHGYPHFYYLDDALPESEYVELLLEGADADAVIRWATTARPGAIETGTAMKIRLHGPGRSAEAVVTKESQGAWRLAVPQEEGPWALAWLRDVSDGYVTVDPDDLQRKIPGPVVVSLGDALQALPKASSEADGHDKPWHVGVDPKEEGEPLPAFEWEAPGSEELRRTALYDVHKDLGAKMVAFAGWEMPVWYTSVLDEHQATRQAAGLFDVSHMGVYQAEGLDAAAFLDSVVGNDIADLQVGESVYTHLLMPDASVIDDLMVYLWDSGYMLVVNAANDDKDWAWLSAVRAGEVRVDERRPWSVAFGHSCRLRDLRQPEAGEDMRVDLALQGPRSREILLALGCDEAAAQRLEALPWAGLMWGRFGDFDLIVSRTGYTGERVAYELFVHPDRAPDLWNALLEAGAPMGLKPAGLGARDSLRTEAGLPLYGQELAGEMNLGVGEAGFAGYVKTYKPWFIGRGAFLAQEASRTRQVARFRFNDRGVRMAHYGDPVVDGRGRVIGKVTSCAVAQDGHLVGQAILEGGHTAEGTSIGVFQGGFKPDGGEAVDLGDRLSVPTPATVLRRFPR